MNPAAPATTKAETTTTTSSSSSSRSSSSEKNIDNAIAFLVHPSVKNATTKTSSKDKRAFLRGKGVTDEEISTAFARAGVREDDDDDKEEEEEDVGKYNNESVVPRYHPTTLANNNNNNRPPAVPYGVIHREGMRWTQMVAYAAALCAFGSYAYPRVKRYWVTSKSDDQMKEEEEEKDQRREEKKHAQMMHAISKSITENLAQFEKKLQSRQETTESAVLASVANVEEKLREELKKVKMTHAEGVVEERERAREELMDVKKSLMDSVEEERREAKKEMETLRKSVLKEMELSREEKRGEEDESPSRRLGEKGYVAERIEAVENNSSNANTNNEDLDLDDYFQAKKRHQMELLGGDGDDDYNNNNKTTYRSPRSTNSQQQRAAHVRKNMGTNHNQREQRVLEEPPRPKNFLEVVELVEKGEPVPGIKDIDDRPPNPDVALPPVSEDFEERTRKPWSMKPSDDESFEGHRPWDKYGNGAAASGEYSFDGGGEEGQGEGGGGWTPPSVPQMSDSARQAFGL